MKNFPESYPEVQKPNSRDRAAHPSRSDKSLQSVGAGLARRVQEKIIVTPVTQAQGALRDPRQERKHDANLETENNVEDDA